MNGVHLTQSEAFTPQDLAATIFHALGIGPDRELEDAPGRAYRVDQGEPIRSLF